MKTLEYKPEGGRMFCQVAKEAIDFARNNICRDMQPVAASFTFNGIEILARSDSSVSDICLIYDLQNQIRRLKLGYKD